MPRKPKPQPKVKKSPPKAPPQPTGRQRWLSAINSPRFAVSYLWGSVAVLLATTAYWAWLGARVNLANADQLVNSYLFERAGVFRDAWWPSAHTFLLKWPLFLMVHALGATPNSFTVLTVVTVLLTVVGLVLFLRRIEARPLVLGTLCLALASVLLFIPNQPYAGGLLPVNMAMLTTRNLEYVVYLASLYLLIRAPRIRSRTFVWSTSLLVLLIASDKLFMTLAVGGALLALNIYALRHRWSLVSLSARWLVSGAVATLGAFIIHWLFNMATLTHVACGGAAGPFTLNHASTNLVLGLIYAALGLLTNLGANPVFATSILRQLPHQLAMHIFHVGTVGYGVNVLIVIFGVLSLLHLLRHSLRPDSDQGTHFDTYERLAILLLWSSIVAVAAFVATQHYYAADARYLTIGLFTVFVSLAVISRQREWRPRRLLGWGVVFMLAVVIGLFQAHHTARAEDRVLTPLNDRNALVVQVLQRHRVDVLVGDYWRVVPTKLQSGNHQTVMPLSNCTQPRNVLTSQVWQPDLNTHSFAYLLSLDRSLTDFPQCNLDQVVQYYGRPNTSVVISGSLEHPNELLLFYDRGTQHSQPKSSPPLTTPTVLPIPLDQLPQATCNSPTLMNIVAHQDDDLLFMSPDLLHSVRDKYCIRTIYITAGDAGAGSYYWLSREQGSEAAYSEMLGNHDVWIERIVKLPGGEFAHIANPRGNPAISLIFLHLPDGNVTGLGFGASHNESLARLEADQITRMHTVDGQSSYSTAQLSDALVALIHQYEPTEIHTQANDPGHVFPDHSDHMAVGRIAQKAYDQYEQEQFAGRVTIPLKFYLGYPVHELMENVSGDDLRDKAAAFFAYSNFDNGTCHSMEQCQHAAYGAYLPRQYPLPN